MSTSPAPKPACFALVWAAAACFTPPPGDTGPGDDGTTEANTSGTSPGSSGPTPPSATGSTDPPSTSGSGTSESSTSAGEEESTTGQPVMCNDVCAPDPGEGWTGPFALADGARGCASDYPAQGDILFGDLEPGDASCACECASPSVTCSTEITGTSYGSNICSAVFSMGSLDPGDCIDTGFSGYRVALGEASSSCAGGSVASTLPEPTWGTSTTTCTGDAIESACPDPGDTCFPRPADPLGAELCVASEGDELCPTGYPSKTVYFRDFTDDRSCPGSCSCMPTTPTCSVDVWRSDDSDTCFDLTPLATITVDSGGSECVAGNNNVESIEIEDIVVADAGMCTSGAAALTGDASETDPVTICCM